MLLLKDRRHMHGSTCFARICKACCWPNWMFVFNRSKACSRLFAPANWLAMPRNLLNIAVFSIGLAAVLGIGIAYIASNAIAFAVTVVIAGCYLAGAAE